MRLVEATFKRAENINVTPCAQLAAARKLLEPPDYVAICANLLADATLSLTWINV